MARSREFPQYAWQPLTRKVGNGLTRWTPGRKSGQPTVVFVHTTEGSEGRTSAEDGAAYDARRTDGTSAHFFVDQDTTVQEVETTDEAHTARAHGNDVGIHIEVCGRAGQTAAQWADAASTGAIEQTARLAVALRRKYPGRFPLVNLTPAQLRAGSRGFAEHRDATLAWPEDGGTHTDPGPAFPWAQLFARIRELETPKEAPAMALELTTQVPLTPDAKSALGVTNDTLPLSSVLNLLLIHSARVSRNVNWAPGPVITAAKSSADSAATAASAAGAAATAARNATEALTHDPADGGNTAEQDSLKSALGL